MSAEQPSLRVLQAYCLTLEQEQARLTKEQARLTRQVQDLTVTVDSQVAQIHDLLAILAKTALHQKTRWYCFHIEGPDITIAFRRVVDAVWTDLQRLPLPDGISSHMSDTEMCSCAVVQYEESIELSVHVHHFFPSLDGVRQHFSVLDTNILGHSWQIGASRRRNTPENGREQLHKLFSGQVSMEELIRY